ncbi:MAG: ribonuclease T2 [Acidobacteriota bacterium]|nr:ribonuclease T2 [Acidobacteriota bacterium]
MRLALRRWIAIAALIAMTGCGPKPSQTAEFAQAQSTASPAAAQAQSRADYDFYLLNLSWSPEFCSTHPGSEECAAHPGLIVHGMWPQRDDGTYPEHCGMRPGPRDARAYTDMIPNAGLVRHEWQTHGTCTPYDADAYFSLIRRAYRAVHVPAQLQHVDHELVLPPVQILDAFAAANPSYPRAAFAVSCGNNRLTAVEVCLAKDLTPQACQSVRSCRANVVRVTPQQ